ncbi:MAG TPA: LON peptidase substrate-binding domain-containing protein, partial [Nannocystis sp.]
MDPEAQPDNTESLRIPDVLPLLPLRNAVAFPLAVIPLVVGQPRSVRLVDEVMRANRLIALVAQRTETAQPAGPGDLYRVGTAGVIRQLTRAPDGNLHLAVQGLERVRILDFTATDPYLVARIEVYPDQLVAGTELEAHRRALIDVLRRLSALIQPADDPAKNLAAVAEALQDPRQLAYLVASVMPIEVSARQEILELDPVHKKLRRLVEVLQREVAVRELGHQIDTATRERLSKSQREHILREQLRSIQRELGETEEGADLDELRRRLEASRLPDEARREAERELARLATLPPAAAEHGMIRTYLEWLADLPWNTLTGGAIDLHHARAVLDEDHYDLEKIKDRLIEYLAVKKLRQERRAPPASAAGDGQPAQPERETTPEGEHPPPAPT